MRSASGGAVPRRRTNKGVDPRFPPEIPSEIPVLLRDAQPTYADIEGETDVRKRRANERARDVARDRLMKMYREALKSGQLDKLDFGVRMFCEELRKRNRRHLPKPKGGRPTNEHRRLLIAVDMRETIDRHGGKRGSVERALKEVTERQNTTYRYVRNIHYDRDPEWRRTVKAELTPGKAEVEGLFEAEG
jgi:hypothetical protein